MACLSQIFIYFLNEARWSSSVYVDIPPTELQGKVFLVKFVHSLISGGEDVATRCIFMVIIPT